MLKRLIVTLLILTATLMAYPVRLTMADDNQNCVQVTQYGGAVGVVCGAKHEPVNTGLADINPIVLASIFFAMAGITLAKYKKLVRSEVGL